MRLIHTDYGIEFELEENKVQVVVIESPEIYSGVLYDLWHQLNGESGGFILSDLDKEFKLSQKAEGIFNPFSINCNDKKILTKLYQELKDVANDRLSADTSEFNATLIEYFDNILELVPYHLKYEVPLDILPLFKVCGVSLDTESGSLLDSIVDYVRAIRQICNTGIVFFVGIKDYLSKEETQQLYEAAFYEKIQLVLFEANDRELLEFEKKMIIDKDCCIIKVN